MTTEPRHSLYGTPLSDWIKSISGELPLDAVGLWQFIPQARTYFNLDDEDLVSVTRLILHSLLACGARPVIGGAGTDHYWVEQTQYGTRPDEVVDNIIAEWRGWGLGDPTVSGIWFALPELFG